MFTAGGHIDHLSFGGVFGGGGKGGGGSSYTPPPTVYTDPVNGMSFTDDPFQFYPLGTDVNSIPTPKTGSQKLNEEIAARQAQEAQQSAAQQAQTDQQNTQNEATFQQRLGDATNQGRANIEQYFRSQGLDPTQYAGDIGNAINTARSSVADLDPNPMAAFDPNLGAQIVNQLTSGKQNQALSSFNSIFGPTYSQDRLSLDAINPSIDQVLSSQFDPLGQQLINAQKRNTLNDTGYQAALDALNGKRTAARSTLNTLGSGIINSDRSALDSYLSGGRNAASSLTLNNFGLFDPNSYLNEANSMVGNDLSNLTGDLTNAVGDTKFADLTELLNAGGSVQGANNPSATNLNGDVPTAAYIADQALKNQKRGLGTVGAF